MQGYSLVSCHLTLAPMIPSFMKTLQACQHTPGHAVLLLIEQVLCHDSIPVSRSWWWWLRASGACHALRAMRCVPCAARHAMRRLRSSYSWVVVVFAICHVWPLSSIFISFISFVLFLSYLSFLSLLFLLSLVSCPLLCTAHYWYVPKMMDRAYGAILGACCGDAAGAVLEFLNHPPTDNDIDVCYPSSSSSSFPPPLIFFCYRRQCLCVVVGIIKLLLVK